MVIGIINQSIARTQYTNGLPQYNSIYPIAVGIYKSFIDDNIIFLSGARLGFCNFDAIEFVACV